MSRFREPVRDELLVLEVQDGCLGALDELVQRWQGRLLCHARRLVQDTDGISQSSRGLISWSLAQGFFAKLYPGCATPIYWIWRRKHTAR